MCTSELFSRFVDERRYLTNVSPRTIEGYHVAWKALEGAGGLPPLIEDLTPISLKTLTMHLATKGLSPVSVNVYLRVLATFLRWLWSEHHLPILLQPCRLKEPKKILPTFTLQHIQKLISAKPTSINFRRAQAAALVVLDTGLRAAELVGLKRNDVDLDNCLLAVNGKGGKQRQVPFGVEARKILYRHLASHTFDPVFATRSGRTVIYRNLGRDFTSLCAQLGIDDVRRSFHTLRHTFAYNYIRSGGSPLHLQRVLGHTSLEMTRRYVNLQTADLQMVHNSHSALQICR